MRDNVGVGVETIPALPVELERTWRSLGIALTDSSYEGERLRTTAEMGRDVEPDELAPLLEEPTPEVVLGEVLGEGGMGVVRSGVQRALRREVAVKAMRPDVRRADALLREARAIGGLEHPNIVPVHVLGRDPAGRPLLVMKRVDGVPWTERIDGDTSPASLRRHVEILRAVVRAVRFAHARGVLHRDIKPDNVMIGAFGEVYLMDWGIAAQLATDHPIDADLPKVADVRAIEGTPVYMAPEMAAGDGRDIDQRADVYLLGASLHHVLCGAPPHEGGTLHAILVSAFLSTPRAYGGHVPEELVAIVHRAMHRDPDARFENAEALDEALEAFLTHEGSRDLVAEGLHRTALASTEDRATRDERLREARFAFEQALRSWPQNERARRELRALFEVRVEDALLDGAAAVAAAWLREHDAPPPELVARVERALVEADSKARRLQSLERDADPSVGARQRVLRGAYGGGAWAAVCLLFGWLARSGRYEIDHAGFAVLGVAFLAIDLAWVYREREIILSHAKNRRLAWAGAVVFGLGALLWPLFGLAGVSLAHTTALAALINGTIWTLASLDFGKSWIGLPLAHLPAAIGAWFWPEWHLELFSLAGLSAIFVARSMVVTPEESA
ncbi:MAG: protein kinase [Sandaracinus sp.]|nr:protein kinase [Sandaracinus sp.]